MSRVLVGFHGKLPGAGDFVQRRLPAAFVDPWDAAMQSMLAHFAEIHGQAWRSRFLATPTWRFALTAGRCGPMAWAGVMAPSVDRVGRPYPLVLAAPMRDDGEAPARLPGPAWFAALESATGRSGGGITVSVFDAVVAMLPDPHIEPTHTWDATDSTGSVWWQQHVEAAGLALADLPVASDCRRLLGGGQMGEDR